ncbi:hypothetical protein BJF93_04215 [Xaviernesmea oryzae]|uniref:DUF4142 domain-containing protein n=2 Tax=Xaviernesmea oryzae TaxID=464029 RepID=A0A1Q9AV66_9HYPH|nr:hypothetical protein BJF93_04215 [Xaviernesmea oryzae]SEK85425.1 putative membrane protein [Xaviernesmea oryzae]
MRRFRAACLGTVLALSPALAFAQAQTSPSTDAPAPMASSMAMDKSTFVKMAGSSNEFEIESSKLAEKRAKSADVKKFARQMVADHTKAGKEMKTAAKMPKSAKPDLAPKHAAMMKQLEAAKGAEFQTMYVDMQVQAHNEAVDLFSGYSKSGDDPALKQFATKTLPTLEMHREHVMRLTKTQ